MSPEEKSKAGKQRRESKREGMAGGAAILNRMVTEGLTKKICRR